MWLVLASLAHARCSLSRDSGPDGVTFTLVALEEPVRCRDVSLASDVDTTLRAVRVDTRGRSHRLPAERLRATADGWRVAAPELDRGDTLRLEVDPLPEGSRLDVILGAPPPRPDARHVRWTEQHRLDATHPARSYEADGPGATDVALDVAVDVTAPSPWRIDLPPGARVGAVSGARVRRGGLEALPDAALITARWTVPGVPAHDTRSLGPGSVELLAPGVHWVVGASGDVQVAATPGGVRADVAGRGVLRWRADRVMETPIATLERERFTTFLHRARRRTRRLGTTPDDVLAGLARTRMAATPWDDPLRPRTPRQVFGTNWRTPMERGLLLAAALDAHDGAALADVPPRVAWFVTGTDADAATRTGFERVLVRIDGPDGARWLDAACDACAPGEVATDLRGRPLLDTQQRVPTGTGVLRRALRLDGAAWSVRFRAQGAAALWLREVALAVDVERRPARLATVLGIPDATLDSTTGLATPGAEVVVEAHGPTTPRAPIIPHGAWDGGWRDEAFDAAY